MGFIEDFIIIFIANPWIILLIGCVTSGLMIGQIILVIKMRSKGVPGAGWLVGGFLVAATSIILLVSAWALLDVIPFAAAGLFFTIVTLLWIAPILSALFVLIGFYKLYTRSAQHTSKKAKIYFK
jgi:hypothetical protein